MKRLFLLGVTCLTILGFTQYVSADIYEGRITRVQTRPSGDVFFGVTGAKWNQDGQPHNFLCGKDADGKLVDCANHLSLVLTALVSEKTVRQDRPGLIICESGTSYAFPLTIRR